MGVKEKGANAERELLRMFWAAGFACARVAGSGCVPKPSCDLLAGNDLTKLAIECKTSIKTKKYIEKEQMADFMLFSKKFGLTPLVAVKFNRQGWWFIHPEKLEKTEKSLAISLEDIKRNGCSFKDMIDLS